MVLKKQKRSGQKELKYLSKQKRTRRTSKNKTNKYKNSRMKIAVYGSLRRGQSNHHVLKDETFLGTFETEPTFTMYSIKNTYPALVQGGNTSIKVEVYEIKPSVLEHINTMEGYYENNKAISIYLKYKIVTPYGIAVIFLYNKDISDKDKIVSGDWEEYKEQIKLLV